MVTTRLRTGLGSLRPLEPHELLVVAVAAAALVAVHTARLNELLATFTDTTSAEKRAAVETYFWLIEEYKVSQFAQELGTAEKVSPERLDRLWAEVSGG